MNKLSGLKTDCCGCRGFCCRALFFFKSDGFPYDKPAKRNCKNLLADYRCKIHDQLEIVNYYGCINYDCLGAGQKTAMFKEDDQLLFEVFEVMVQLHEILWYLYVGKNFVQSQRLNEQLETYYQMIESLTYLDAEEILALDLNKYRQLVNPLLQEVYCQMNKDIQIKPLQARKTVLNRADFMGCDLHEKDLRGQDFKGAFLIGANLSNCDLCGVNFLGSDVRKMDIRNSDLSKSLFLTPAQISACVINRYTKLPEYIGY